MARPSRPEYGVSAYVVLIILTAANHFNEGIQAGDQSSRCIASAASCDQHQHIPGAYPPFPTWAKAARIIFAMSPSSAASERVFSLVNSMFGKEQLHTLADFVQGSLMLRYNKRNVG